MQTELIKFLTFAGRPLLTKYKYSSYIGVQFSLNPTTAIIISSGHLQNCRSLHIKRAFKTMQCCGNSCGMDLSKGALKKKLTSMQYQVTQEGDTERAFTGKYYNHFEKGIYGCIVCNQDLFSSDAKFDSKCGWPAFSDVVDSSNVKYKTDMSHDMKRTEASCSKCGAHLGHVFDDGPKPSGKRYCVNSAALDFRKDEEADRTDPKS